MPLCFNFKASLSYHTFSKALDMSKKALLTSNSLLKDLKILQLIDNSWLIQESLGWKPNWFLEIQTFIGNEKLDGLS